MPNTWGNAPRRLGLPAGLCGLALLLVIVAPSATAAATTLDGAPIPRGALVTDARLYSTLLGGSASSESAKAVAVDAQGNTYVAGVTWSPDFPVTPGAYDTTLDGAGPDAFVVQFDPAGNLVFATFLGGSGAEDARGIAIDAAGNILIVGGTDSVDFPTTAGALGPSPSGNEDMFLAKLSPAGDVLLYGTYLGGRALELAYGVAVDASGAAYISGVTNSTDFPATPGALDTSYDDSDLGCQRHGGCWDSAVAKVSPDGTHLEYATYLGGELYDVARAIRVDPYGDAIISGESSCPAFPATPGAFRSKETGGPDVFVAKLDPMGTSLVYSSCFGGLDSDQGWGLDVDPSGSAYVTGRTFSRDFPTTPGAFNNTFGLNYSADVFVAKLTPSGTALAYSSLIAGNDSDYGQAIAVDANGTAWVTGWTYSADFPVTSNAIDPTFNADRDLFVLRLGWNGAKVLESTFIGGDSGDFGWAIAVGPGGTVSAVGETWSSDFPVTPGAFDTTPGGLDAFLLRITPAEVVDDSSLWVSASPWTFANQGVPAIGNARDNEEPSIGPQGSRPSSAVGCPAASASAVTRC